MRSNGPKSRTVVGLVAFSLFVDYFLYGIVMPLMSHSPAKVGEEQLGLLYGAYAISVLVVTPLFGYLGDRIGGRPSMIIGMMLAGCATALFGIAPNFSLSLLARLCQGAASAAVWTAGLALIAENYVEKRVEMMGYAFTGSTAGSALGPLAGGLLYHVGGYQLPFLFTGVLVVSAACLLVLLPPGGKAGRKATVDLRGLLLNKSVAVPALAVALAALAWGIIEPLLPARLGRYGATPKGVGLMFTAAAITYGLSAPVVGWVSARLPFKRVSVLGAIAMASTLPLLSAFREVSLAGLVLCLVSISFAFLLNPASAELGDAVDRAGTSCYSAVYALYNIVYSLGMLSTAALASTAVRFLGFWGVLVGVSAILILSTPLLLLADSSAPAASEASVAEQT
jgi:MFS transporter, DHA1 family, solute carrier family 18 (vesicular amine transporter), member 1/2